MPLPLSLASVLGRSSTVEVQVLSLDGGTQAVLDGRLARRGLSPTLHAARYATRRMRLSCMFSHQVWFTVLHRLGLKCPCAITRRRRVPSMVMMKHAEGAQGSVEGTKHISHPHCLDDLETLESMRV